MKMWCQILGWTLAIALLAQPTFAASRHLIFRNTNNGGFGYVKLNSNGTVKNTTLNDGIGVISQNFPGTSYTFEHVVDLGSSSLIVVANSARSRYGWMKLNSNGTLENRTLNSGIGWMHPASLNLSSWSIIGVQEAVVNSSSNHLIFQNTVNGALGFIRLNANGTIENDTQNQGFGRINFGLEIPTAWRAFAVQKNGSFVDGTGHDHVLLANSSTGRGAFLRLNTNGTMYNPVLNQGYGQLKQDGFGDGFGDFFPVAIQDNADGSGTDHVYIKNPAGGTQSFYYIRLNSNGTLSNSGTHVNSGLLQSTYILNSFDVLGHAELRSSQFAFLRGPTGGRAAWLRLNDNGTIRNGTVNQGAAWASDDYSGGGWRCEALDPNTYPD